MRRASALTCASLRHRNGRRQEQAFTLFEVLAAFLIFAVLFTVLAGTASQAFRSEGINRRRLEASLLADRRLAEFEESSLEIGEENEEEDIFLISTSVTVLTADLLGLDLDFTRGKEKDRSSTRDDDSNQPGTSILSPQDSDDAALLRIDLRVEWEEGEDTYVVRRSTIALDTSSIEDAFPEVGETSGDDPENTLGGGGDDSDLGTGEDAIQRMLDALSAVQ